jgi:three-Cys-motif partner protein
MLDQYAVRYATKTASKLTPKRAVLFDGFAGTARFDDGSAASAEFMMLAAQKVKASTRIDCFFVEKKTSSFKALDSVADEYRTRGVNIVTRHGECGEHLAEAVEMAKGASLFLFIDPCGATVPWDTMTSLLRGRGKWPRTEVLMNFSADLPRRAGGQVAKGLLDEPGVHRLDKVCGGTWWRQIALDAHQKSGGKDWEAAAEAVAIDYARRLAEAAGMDFAVAPVKRKEHHQPVYYLIFLTHDEHGLWVLGDAATRAREAWIKALGPDDQALEGMLFNTVEDQIEQEHEKATRTIKTNLIALLADGRTIRSGEQPFEIFGDVYGEAKETAYTRAVRELVKEGKLEVVEKGKKPHLDVLRAVGHA